MTTMNPLLRDILNARVYDVAIKTPLELAKKLSASTGHQVYLKREDMQPVHSFKIRGAYNKIVRLTDAEKQAGVIAASAGNHAQGVAYSAKKLGLSALIVMPKTTPAIKIEAVKSYGAEVELAGDSYSEAADYCKQRQTETGRTYIHPFDDPLVIAGQGTIGREILEQQPDVTHIFVPVGGGGLAAGVAQYVKTLRPDVKIIGVQTDDASTMRPSLKKGERVLLDHVGIFADGTAVKQLGENTFATLKDCLDDTAVVTTDQLCAAIKAVFEDTRSIVEPSGALAVAGLQQYDLPQDAVAVAVCSGANVTFERLNQIAERTLIGSGKEALFAVAMPEEPGALYRFCTEVVEGHNISEFSYRLHARQGATIFVGISVSSQQDKQNFMTKMQSAGYTHTDLSGDDLAKEHVRHMIGGHAPAGTSEQIYEVTFPERPGALIDFLSYVGQEYNISLFHYRSAASDSGSVLIGFEASRPDELKAALTKAGYNYAVVSESASISTFLT